MSAELPLGGSRLVPKGWTLYSVDEIKSKEKYACVAGPFGSSISSKYFTEEGIPIIRGSNLKDDLTRFVSQDFAFVSEEQAKNYPSQHVRGGDLVFTCWGTIGQVGIIPEDGPYPEYIISNKQLKLRVNPEIADSLFVYYYLASKEGVEHIRSRAIGSAVPGINLGILKSLTLALPPLVIQQRITEILSNYDRLIDNNTRRIALLEESIHRLYQEWFVYLRFPGCDRMKVVDGVPEGWRKISLGQCADKSGGVVQTGPFGSQLHQHDYRDSGTPVVMPKDIRNDQIVTTSIAYVDDETINRLSRHTLKVGDIVLPRRGDLNKRALITNQQSGWLCGTGCLKISIPNEFISSRYLFFYLKQPQVVERIENQAVGATMLNLSASILQSVEVIVPCSQTQHDFDQITHSILDQISLLNHYNFKLREARDLLLPRLMNGSIPV